MYTVGNERVKSIRTPTLLIVRIPYPCWLEPNGAVPAAAAGRPPQKVPLELELCIHI